VRARRERRFQPSQSLVQRPAVDPLLTRCVDCSNAVIDESFHQTWLDIQAQQRELLDEARVLWPGALQRVQSDIKATAKVLADLGVRSEAIARPRPQLRRTRDREKTANDLKQALQRLQGRSARVSIAAVAREAGGAPL